MFNRLQGFERPVSSPTCNQSQSVPYICPTHIAPGAPEPWTATPRRKSRRLLHTSLSPAHGLATRPGLPQLLEWKKNPVVAGCSEPARLSLGFLWASHSKEFCAGRSGLKPSKRSQLCSAFGSFSKGVPFLGACSVKPLPPSHRTLESGSYSRKACDPECG